MIATFLIVLSVLAVAVIGRAALDPQHGSDDARAGPRGRPSPGRARSQRHRMATS